MKKIFQLGLAALSLVAFTPLATARAYTNEDALLIFRKSGVTNVEYNLGNIAQFRSQPNGYIALVGGWDASLVNQSFGSFASANLKVAVIATTSKVLVNNSDKHVWLTDASASGTPATRTLSAWQNIWSKIDGIGNTPLFTTTSPLVVSTTDHTSYDWVASSGGTAPSSIPTLAGSSTFTVESSIPAALDFWEITPNVTPTQQGKFTLGTNGLLYFTVGTPALPGITNQPVDQSIVYGSNVTFTADVSGVAGVTLSYQWSKNGSPLTDGGNISGATSAALTLTSVVDADAGVYNLTVTNLVGSVTSSNATLTVIDAPVIGTSPASITNNANTTAQFTVTLGSGSTPSYQWYHGATPLVDGGNVSGATTPTLTLSNVFAPDAGNYTVVLSNLAGSVTSSVAVLTVVDPLITSQPVSVSVAPTANASFSVTALGAGLTYQWKQNGTNAPYASAHNATLTISNASALLNGYTYSVVVSNSLGQFVTSSSATLGVSATPIVIVTQPAGATKLQGQSVSFSVKATGTAPFTSLTYQWKRNGTNLSGATGTNYTISVVTTNDAGSYSVAIANAVAATNSASAVLAVTPDTTAPTLVLVSPKTKFETAAATVLVSGTAGDNAGLSSVLVKVGTNSPVSATLTNVVVGKKGLTANWSATVALAAGTNVVVAQAVDFSGNSVTSAPVAYFRQVASAFTVVTNTHGAGLVSITPALPAYIGRTYKITATPDTSSVLSNIVNVATSGTNTTVNPAPLKGLKGVIVVAEAANTVTINFETNRFIGAAGTYYGLFTAPTVTKESAGFFTVKTTAKLGFTGKLTLDGDVLPIAGAFNLDGLTTTKSNTVITVARTGKPTLTVSLQLGFDNTISGSITNTDWAAAVDGDRAVFSVVNQASSYLGNYTLVLPGTPGATNSPAGNGYATLAIAGTGAVKAAGALGDGDVFAPQTASVAADGRWPLFSKQAAGIVAGWVWITNNTVNSTVIATNLYWIKEASAATYYPAGFTNAGFTGAGSVLIAANPLSFAGTNIVATLADGNLVGDITNRLSIGAANKITILGTNNASLKLAYKAANGLLSGTFSTAKTPVKGVFLQSTNYQSAAGYFLGTSQSGSLLVQ
jgi:hypothetical protein